MDVRNINQVHVGINCDPTANVQVVSPASTTDFIGPGEVVFSLPYLPDAADLDSNVIGAATDTTGFTSFVVNSRSRNGEAFYQSQPIKFNDVKVVSKATYAAAVKQVYYLDVAGSVDITLTDYTYIMRVIDKTYTGTHCHRPSIISIQSGATAFVDDAAFIDAWVTAINKRFAFDEAIKLTASNYNDTHLKIVVEPADYKVGTFPFYPAEIELQAVNFDADFTTNLNAALTLDPETVGVATRGKGTYPLVADLEFYAKGNFGNREILNGMYPVNRELSASAAETYDVYTIEWENQDTKNIEGTTLQRGVLTIAVSKEGAIDTYVDGVLVKMFETDRGMTIVDV